MNLPLALGVAFAAIAVAGASAHTTHSRTNIRHASAAATIDADADGWITRAEASGAAERIFDEMDSNDDGRLDGEDRRTHLEEFDVHLDAPGVEVLDGGRRVRVITTEDGERIEREIERVEREVERTERNAERAEREAERAERHAEREAEHAERHAERAARDAERHVERHVHVMSGGSDLAAPRPPHPPRPPVFMMLIANAEEADRNGDGALSRDEFRNQHLRFFDASDANGDGRVRFEAPPEPPTPPTPPTPPEPPRRR